jgi:acyl-CoA dehydrogenase
VAREVAPHVRDWDAAGIVPRSLWRELGAAGLLCVDVPEQYGGAGAHVRFSFVVIEELARANAGGLTSSVSVHSDIIAPYVLNHGTEAQRRAWLPKLCRGEAIGAIGMTEPGAGSDLQALRTQARREGDGWVLSGQKTFITNGQNAGLLVLAARTAAGAGSRGTSLFLVDTALPGYRPGRNLEKLGHQMADTSEIFLEEVRVPGNALLGAEGRGFAILMQELPRERLVIAVYAVAASEAALEWTLAYVRERRAFGRRLADFQNTRFRLAELDTQVAAARVFLEHGIELLARGALDATAGARAKLLTTELQCRVTDECLQLHGGYGYMAEYPIARAWADARVQRIYGGTSEIMKELIARSLLGREES